MSITFIEYTYRAWKLVFLLANTPVSVSACMAYEISTLKIGPILLWVSHYDLLANTIMWLNYAVSYMSVFILMYQSMIIFHLPIHVSSNDTKVGKRLFNVCFYHKSWKCKINIFYKFGYSSHGESIILLVVSCVRLICIERVLIL